jgi:hypothetical protein
MRGITKQAFFLFLSFGESVLRFAQWLQYRSPPAILPDNVAETDLCLQAGSGGETTCRLLSVLDGDLEYLSREEADNIIARFEGIPSSLDTLLFWTGLPREWAQRWADEHGMLTLTSAMGPLMDIAHPQCLKGTKKSEDWSRYVKGASSIFSRYACTCGVVRVLTVPPSETWRLRPNSTFHSIEEPVLKGVIGSAHVLRLKYVHLLSGSKNTEYEVWPEDHTQAWLDSYGNDILDYMLPPATLTTGKKKKKKKKKGEEEKLGGSTAKAHLVTETRTNDISCSKSGNQAVTATSQQPIFNVATPKKNKANKEKKKKKKKKKKNKPDGVMQKKSKTMTKEQANSTAKNKARGKAKRKSEREAKVSERTI